MGIKIEKNDPSEHSKGKTLKEWGTPGLYREIYGKERLVYVPETFLGVEPNCVLLECWEHGVLSGMFKPASEAVCLYERADDLLPLTITITKD